MITAHVSVFGSALANWVKVAWSQLYNHSNDVLLCERMFGWEEKIIAIDKIVVKDYEEDWCQRWDKSMKD